jgi:uncharacterized protein (TIGR02145 family)
MKKAFLTFLLFYSIQCFSQNLDSLSQQITILKNKIDFDFEEIEQDISNKVQTNTIYNKLDDFDSNCDWYKRVSALIPNYDSVRNYRTSFYKLGLLRSSVIESTNFNININSKDFNSVTNKWPIEIQQNDNDKLKLYFELNIDPINARELFKNKSTIKITGSYILNYSDSFKLKTIKLVELNSGIKFEWQLDVGKYFQINHNNLDETGRLKTFSDFSKDNKYLVVNTENQSNDIYNLENGQLLNKFVSKSIGPVKFSNNSRFIINVSNLSSGIGGLCIAKYSMNDKTSNFKIISQRILGGSVPIVNGVFLSADDKMIYITSPEVLLIFDAITLDFICRLNLEHDDDEGYNDNVVMSNNNKYLVFYPRAGHYLRILNLSTNKFSFYPITNRSTSNRITSVKIDPYSNYIAVATVEGIRFIDINSGKDIYNHIGDGNVGDLWFANGGLYLIYFNAEGKFIRYRIYSNSFEINNHLIDIYAYGDHYYNVSVNNDGSKFLILNNNVTNNSSYIILRSISELVNSEPKIIIPTIPIILPSIKIGNQIWTIQNLSIDTFRNGDPIPQVKSAEEWQRFCEEGKAAWCYYNNNVANGNKYGKLYNCYAINDPRGLAPLGWHIPNNEEWSELIKDLGGVDEDVFQKMKSKNWNATNESGLDFLPGGFRDIAHNGKFEFGGLGEAGAWWSHGNEIKRYNFFKFLSTTEDGLSYNDHFDSESVDDGFGFSIRLVKDLQ